MSKFMIHIRNNPNDGCIDWYYRKDNYPYEWYNLSTRYKWKTPRQLIQLLVDLGGKESMYNHVIFDESQREQVEEFIEGLRVMVALGEQK
jgi:hypothetical protein